MIGKKNIDNRYEEEKVVQHLRRHWFVFFKIFLFYVLLFFLPLLIYFFLYYLTPEFLQLEAIAAVLAVLSFSFYLSLLVFAFTTWTDTYLDVWTITTHRIINREQKGLFNRVVSELDLDQIQDVTTEQKGFISTMLDYGDVYIQSAGEKERFVFEQIPRPQQVARTIQKLNDDAKKSLIDAIAV